MSQATKTTFTILAVMLTSVLVSGCGIKGDLYAPGTDTATPAPKFKQPAAVVTPTASAASSTAEVTEQSTAQ